MDRILIADDHQVTRRGLQEILREEFREISFGEARDADEALRLAEDSEWDLILLDIVMPGMGVIELIGAIRGECPDTPILILTAVTEQEYVVRTLQAGANGFISKQHAADELITAVRKVMGGETFLTGEGISHLAASLRGDDQELPHRKLSKREMQVFIHIAQGRTIKEIGGELNLSDKTVGTYLARIKEKTGLISYVEIARYAMRHHLVD